MSVFRCVFDVSLSQLLTIGTLPKGNRSFYYSVRARVNSCKSNNHRVNRSPYIHSSPDHRVTGSDLDRLGTLVEWEGTPSLTTSRQDSDPERRGGGTTKRYNPSIPPPVQGDSGLGTPGASMLRRPARLPPDRTEKEGTSDKPPCFIRGRT